MKLDQLFDMIDIGIVVLDLRLAVCRWNRWMEIHSGISAEEIIGRPAFDFFPNLDSPRFHRNFKAVSTFGNFAFFSRKLHRYLFPLPVPALSDDAAVFDHMQQTCTMGPLRDDDQAIRHVYIMVQDVTEIAAYERKLLKMNMRDGLTGAFNRRYLEIRLREEMERYARYGRPFSVILQDLDWFKAVNDTHGHLCGDFVLTKFSALMKSRLRKSDMFARFGGEEFCVLLTETEAEKALLLAEELRALTEQTEFEWRGTKLSISISQGVSEIQSDEDGPESVLERADQALYRAKMEGRNQVVVHRKKEKPCVSVFPKK
ncbi:MAG: diguanylate cyclase [Desulfococcaceae bacterium]